METATEQYKKQAYKRMDEILQDVQSQMGRTTNLSLPAIKDKKMSEFIAKELLKQGFKVDNTDLRFSVSWEHLDLEL